MEFLGDDDDPAINNVYKENTGKDGSMFGISAYAKNVINANFALHFSTWHDYKIAKAEVYRSLLQKGLIRYRTDSNLAKVNFVRAASFNIKPNSDGANDCFFTIPFENPSGYKYSLYPSDQLYKYSAESWQYGMHLPIPTDKLKYHFINENNIYVYNASDITVDPYFQRHELKIIIKRYGSQSFGLVNNTTGTQWNYNGSLTNNDILMIDGINTYKNGVTDNLNTDYGYLTLAPGWNNISITGVNDLDILFSFPFIYLA